MCPKKKQDEPPKLSDLKKRIEEARKGRDIRVLFANPAESALEDIVDDVLQALSRHDQGHSVDKQV